MSNSAHIWFCLDNSDHGRSQQPSSIVGTAQQRSRHGRTPGERGRSVWLRTTAGRHDTAARCPERCDGHPATPQLPSGNALPLTTTRERKGGVTRRRREREKGAGGGRRRPGQWQIPGGQGGPGTDVRGRAIPRARQRPSPLVGTVRRRPRRRVLAPEVRGRPGLTGTTARRRDAAARNPRRHGGRPLIFLRSFFSEVSDPSEVPQIVGKLSV